MSATQPITAVRHSKFYIDDRKPFVTFLVEGQLFRVHRYMFELESEVFKSMFEIPQGDNSTEGETDESPIVLPSVRVPEMEALLNFFYFREGLEEIKFTKDDWWYLLSISHRYECERARQRSIKEIDKLRPVDHAFKIAMAKKYGVEEWLLPACVALVEREGPLTHAEAEKLGLNMTVLLCEAREKYNVQRQGSAGSNPAFRNPHSVFIQPHYLPGQQLSGGADATQLVKEILHIK